MAGVSLRVDASELAGASEDVVRRLRAAGRTRDMFDAIGAALVSSTLQRFEDQRGPDGKPWKPSIRARAEAGQTLIDKGHLRASITYAAGVDHVQEGSNLVYARPHQEGGQVGRGLAVNLPARPYLGIDDGDEREIGDIVLDHLREAMEQ